MGSDHRMERDVSCAITVRKLEAKPGDLLILTVPKGVPYSKYRAIADSFKPCLPKGVLALVLVEGMTLDQVRVDAIVPAGAEGVFTVL